MGVATATALAIGALAVSAVGAIQSGVAANQQAKFQSQVATQRANRAKQVAEANERDFRRKVSAAIAGSRAGIAGAGGDLSGSQLLSMEDFAAEAEVDALNIRQGGQIQASRLLQQADLLRAGGKQAQTAGFIRAGASILQGASTVGRFGAGGGGVTEPGLEPQLFDEA